MRQLVVAAIASLAIDSLVMAQDRPTPSKGAGFHDQIAQQAPELSKSRSSSREKESKEDAPASAPMKSPPEGRDLKDAEIKRLKTLNAAYQKKIDLLEARIRDLESSK